MPEVWHCLRCGKPVGGAWKYDLWCDNCQDFVMAVKAKED